MPMDFIFTMDIPTPLLSAEQLQGNASSAHRTRRNFPPDDTSGNGRSGRVS